MRPAKPAALSKRERQIMDVVYRRGRATAAEIHRDIDDPPTYTTVRGLLRILESKGHVRHEQEGPRYVFVPSMPRQREGANMLSHVVRTFFDGSPSKAMAALLGTESAYTEEELRRLESLIDEKREQRATRSRRDRGQG
jgi:predicted transcriptional regulator